MNLIELQNTIKAALREAARELFEIHLEQIVGEVPPRIKLGDLAFPIAFELAKQIKRKTGEKRAPRTIAEALKANLEAMEFVARVEVAGAGYLNVFFDRAKLLADITAAASEPSTKQKTGQRKLMVEHTSINPNKAAHIGHVRNSVIGDTFVNILQAVGNRVEVQNYIDNTGVQVADVVVGFVQIENMTLDDIKTLDRSLPPDQSFDYYCWDLYTRVGLFYRDGKADGEQNPEKLKLRAEILHAIEAGNNSTAELADYVATRNVEQILNSMERLGIRYDLL
ncbi:MAG TPA: arginine--tRNA ligase, partial [Pyrinomonadaceae bacterium]|nr:arginine--tRNA ligase [Pyrinomonadaceae bacterium]